MLFMVNPSDMSETTAQRKVLLIGWDAADWKSIRPLLDAGKMPVLKRMIEGGVWGRIATLRTILSPMLWTSIATGVRPFRHGVHGFTEPDPDTGRVRPVTSTSRKVKAIWNILNQNGRKSNVIGWWPSHPAEPINGVMVSNHYHRATAPPKKPWPMRPGAVHPQRLEQPLKRLRLHPAELVAEHILPFVPKAAEVDRKKDQRLMGVARTIAECTTVHAAATAVMQLEPWDFMAVYYDAIDHFGHGFMRYHPPRQAHVSERDFELYGGVMEAAYRYHDMMLGTLLKLAGPDTIVILMSDHGFHPDHLRPAHIPFEPAGPAVEHSPYGILAMCGPGVKRGDRLHGATLLDIAPTLLTIFGLPVGRDMQGKPIVEAFEEPPPIQTLMSWQQVDGDDGSHEDGHSIDPQEAQESLQQLIDLGYIEDPGEDAKKAVEQTRRELNYNLAQSYMDDNRHDDAMSLLEDLWRKWPDELRFANHLMLCYRALGRVGDLRRIVDELLEARQRLASQAKQELGKVREKIQARRAERNKDEDAPDVDDEQVIDQALREEVKERGSESIPHVADGEEIPQSKNSDSADQGEPDGTKQDEDDSAGDTPKPVLSPEERHELAKWRFLARPSALVEPYMRGLVALAEGSKEEALELLLEVASARAGSIDLELTLGQLFAELGRWEDARASFEAVLVVDPDQARAHLGLSRCCLAARQNLDAAEHALNAVGLSHYFPEAHLSLGTALHRCGRVEAAVSALRVALAQNPGLAAAHKRLAHIYERRLNDPKQAAHHRDQAHQLRVSRRVVQPLIDQAVQERRSDEGAAQ